jgi:hypothetical protein
MLSAAQLLRIDAEGAQRRALLAGRARRSGAPPARPHNAVHGRAAARVSTLGDGQAVVDRHHALDGMRQPARTLARLR